MIKKFHESLEQQWDSFVDKESVNGCFEQTRRFLKYHGTRYDDCSLLFYKGDQIAAVLPACRTENKEIISHMGATFGGIIISKKFATITNYQWILDELEQYIQENDIRYFEIRVPSYLYQKENTHIDVLEYLLMLRGYSVGYEVGFFLDLQKLEDDFERYYSVLRKRKLKKAIKAGLIFRELVTSDEIYEFYKVLEDNYVKFGTHPVHSFKEMLLLKEKCISEELSFFGVFYQDTMVAGSMVFAFNGKQTFHTQYLASEFSYLDLCPNEFLYTNLIYEARKLGFRYLSFGTTTLEHGKVFNESLALFKEGFHTETYINKTYVKRLGFKE